MALDDKKKQGIISMDYTFGFKKSYMGAKVWNLADTIAYGGTSCTVYKDGNDPEYKAKVKGLRLAIKTVVDAGFNLPAGAKAYCTNWYEAQNRAFLVDDSWKNICLIMLGPAAVKTNDSLASVSNSRHPKFDKVTVTCIHEIGHSLHAEAIGLDRFFDSGWQGAAKHAHEVSAYSAGSKKEYVAEYFAGRMIGRKYTPGARDEYLELGGPSSASFP